MSTADYLTQLQQDREDLVDNLEAKGITGLTGDETFTELVPEVLNIPTGGGTTEPEEKDVNFYDYDGTRVYSYTKSEFLALNQFPANPTHDGLTSLGWNWDYQTAVNYVTTYGTLNVGQLYNTSDGKLRIYVELDENTLSLYLGYFSNKQSTVYWGDGTTSTHASGYSYYKDLNHTYATPGKYTISIESSGTITIPNDGIVGSVLLRVAGTASSNNDKPYLFKIKKLELSSNTKINQYGLSYLSNLEYITMPDIGDDFNSGALMNNKSLKCLIMPKSSYQNIGSLQGFESLERLIYNYNTSTLNRIGAKTKNVTITPNVTTISSNYAASNYGITKVVIPSSVTNIQGSAFQECYNLFYVDLTHHTSVPTLGTNVFSNLTKFYIIVPDDLYETWKTTSGWSTYASYIISKTDWDTLNS